jgi:hypothetical protein
MFCRSDILCTQNSVSSGGSVVHGGFCEKYLGLREYFRLPVCLGVFFHFVPFFLNPIQLWSYFVSCLALSALCGLFWLDGLCDRAFAGLFILMCQKEFCMLLSRSVSCCFWNCKVYLIVGICDIGVLGLCCICCLPDSLLFTLVLMGNPVQPGFWLLNGGRQAGSRYL